jgi:predicted RNA-binding protein YlqC (UPF0109 family)
MVKELLEQIVKKLVSKPQEVAIEVIEKSPDKQLYTIKVAPQDRGKVIGRQGQTIQSIRALVHAVIPHAHHISLDISQE